MSFNPILPWSKELIDGLEYHSRNNKIEYHIEYVDKFRTDDLLNEKEWLEYLTKKYQKIKFDAILVDASFASNIFQKIENNFANENIPIIYLLRTTKIDNDYTFALATTAIDIHKKTLNMILKYHPKLKNLYVTKGQIPDFLLNKEDILEEIKGKNINVIMLEDFTFEELYSKVKNLSSDSAIFYNVIYKDRNDERSTPYEILEKILKNTNAPVYSSLYTLINRGIVGGTLLNPTISMHSMNEAALDYINNKKFKSSYPYYQQVVDWNMLKKFRINESLIEKDTKIINKPKSIFETYFYEVVTVIFLICFLFLLLVVSLFFTYRLKNLNGELKEETKKRIEKEQMLSRESRMAAMGQMIGNIAHQWKQPLGIISMSNGLIKMYNLDNTLFTKDEVDDSIQNIDNTVKYLTETIDDFRNFLMTDKKKSFFKLKNIYEKMYRLTKSLYKKSNIEIFDKIEDIEVYGYKNEILQVLLIIIKNAKDELTKESSTQRKLIFVDSYREENHNIIKIRDNAGGISKDIINKIFDPYFTTKENDEGTGIGLYMSKQIIEGMDGSIDVFNVNYVYEEVEYLGAEFIIKLNLDIEDKVISDDDIR